MKIKPNFLGLIIVVILFGGVFASSALNLWKTDSPKIPQKFAEGEFAGKYDPSDIRGSYAFDDVSSAFSIPVEDLKYAFGLSEDIDTSIFKNKDLESIYGSLEDGKEIGNGSVKLFVALYTGSPYEMDEETYLPKPAVDILKAKASLTEEQVDYLDNHMVDITAFSQKSTVDLSNPSNENKASNTQENSEDHYIDEKLVRGKTSFKEVLDWGVNKETIEKIIDGEIPNTNMLIRDYCTDNGLEFSAIKSALQSEVDSSN